MSVHLPSSWGSLFLSTVNKTTQALISSCEEPHLEISSTVPGIISLYFPSFTMRLSPAKCMENRTSFSVLGFYFKKGPQSWISTQDIPQDPICVGDAETEQTYLGEKIEGHWQADLWAFSSLVKDRGERGSSSHKRQTLSIEDHKSSVQTRSATSSPLC